MLHRGDEKTKDMSSAITSRTALDSMGHLGSLYDACHDRVLGPLGIMSERSPSNEYQGKSMCTLIKGVTNPKQNLLAIVNIDEQLRLSMLLNQTSKTGLAAIVNYPNLINTYTRVLHYTYIHRAAQYSDEVHNLRNRIHINPSETTATHLITGIRWGIVIVVILQLPEQDNMVTMIDGTLEKYRAYLNGDSNGLRLTQNDLDAQKTIINTKVYSNVMSMNDLESLHTVFHNICRLKLIEAKHRPLSYILYSIPNVKYIPLEASQFEQRLYELSTLMKMIEACFNQDMESLLCGNFTERFSNAYKAWTNVNAEYRHYVERYSTLVIDIRSGNRPISALNDMLRKKINKTLKNKISSLCDDVMELNRKAHLINNFNNQNILYLNAAERHIDSSDDLQCLQRKLATDDKAERILCSNDTLNKEYPEKLRILSNDLLEELQTNSKVRLIYVDFTYSNHSLTDMILLPLVRNSKQKKTSKFADTSMSTEVTSSTQSLPLHHQTMHTTSSNISLGETINMLLLGAIGSGKTTFINAFVNYFTYQTLDQAHTNKVAIPIPASFSLSVPGESQQCTVQGGDLTQKSNENFQHPDQATTQHCKSYIYNLHNRAGTKLRFIDTPGFDDARGETQDKLNMEKIIDYVKKIGQLNAVCVFIKPSEARANMFFRIYFPQIIGRFGSNIRRKVIFCFTNSRSILYQPGNIVPVMKTIFSSLGLDDIPFTRKNQFYFDNESFRYLLALENKIQFSEDEKQGIEMSWLKSTTEASRFIRYIRRKLQASFIPDEGELIRRLEFEVAQMIHPLLENIRKILRKIIINKMNQVTNSPDPNFIDDPLDVSLESDNNHDSELPIRRPLPIDFLGDYKIEDHPSGQRQKNLINHLLLLCHVNVEFASFLLNVANYQHGDPFVDGFLRMIQEEDTICENQNQNYRNLQLVDGLKKLASNYEYRRELAKTHQKENILQDILNWIKYMRRYPIISKYVIQYSSEYAKNEVKVTSI